MPDDSRSPERTTGCGSPDTWLVVVRGNSGVGKSSVARELRRRHGRGVSLIEQDHVRRVVLWEHDRAGADNIDLIHLMARFALNRGRPVIVEGILFSAHYGAMLTTLASEHRGPTRCYYLAADFDETLRRHETRPQAAEFSAADMREWYREADPIPGLGEAVVPASSSLGQTVRRTSDDLGAAVE